MNVKYENNKNGKTEKQKPRKFRFTVSSKH